MFKKDFLREKLSPCFMRYICPITFGTAICYACMRTFYEPLSVVYTIIFVVCEFMLFLLFDYLKSKKNRGGLIYTVLLLFVIAVSMNMTRMGVRQLGYLAPMFWFYGSDMVDAYQPLFMNAFFIGGGFFLISVLYYFTQVRFRMAWLMLCMLFPFVIYAKRLETMPDMLVTLIVTLFFATAVHNRNTEIYKNNVKFMKCGAAYLLSFAIFVSFVSAAVLFIKKPQYFSELEKNASFFDNIASGGYGAGGYQNLNKRSASRSGGHSFADIPLFYLADGNRQNKTYFLRRQAYDFFDGDLWEIRESKRLTHSTEYPEYASDDIVQDAKAIADDFKENITLPYYTEMSVRVFDNNFRSVYLPAPLGTVTDDLPGDKLKYIKHRQNSYILRVNSLGKRIPKPLDDIFTYMDFEDKLYEYAEFFDYSTKDYIALLESNAAKGSAEAYRLLEDYEYARKNYTDVSGVSAKLANLASAYVSHCDSEIEKAYALEKYFRENGYEYSLEYVPEDKSIDYFVFSSKKGFCANYATAMTLMARSVGLPARYVEGYAASERTNNGNIVVRDSDAHAVTEVYIPAAGWLTFDPTVPAAESEEGDGVFDLAAFLHDVFSKFFIAIIAIVPLIIIFLLKTLKKALFWARFYFAFPDKKIIMLYKKLVSDVSKVICKDCRTYTPKKLELILADIYGFDMHDFFELYEKTAFGGYLPSKEQFDAVYFKNKKYLRRRYIYKFYKRICKNRNKDLS